MLAGYCESLNNWRCLHTEEAAVTCYWTCFCDLNEEAQDADSLTASVVLLWRWITSPVDISHRQPSKGRHAKGTSRSLRFNHTQIDHAQDHSERLQ